MQTIIAIILSAAAAAPGAPLHARPAGQPTVLQQFESYREAQRRSCKAVSTCEEAVAMWCGGYSRADGDKDGIPCENVCSSKAEVDEIKASIGC